jgi:hypothetical protein
MHITDRLFLKNGDVKRSQEICLELKKISNELPKILADAQIIKEGEYWTLLEEARKAGILNYSQERRKEIQTEIYKTESKINAPRKVHGERMGKLREELSKLTTPIIADIMTLLEREERETLSAKKARFMDSKKEWRDRPGSDTEYTVKVRIIESNFSAIADAMKLLLNFKLSIRGMTGVSIDEIIEAVKKFEMKINKIDLSKTVQEECDNTRWNDLREVGLV